MIKNWLWVFMAVVCVCLIPGSCSDEKESDASYSLGIDSFESSSDEIMAELRRISDAFVAEFGAEKFTLSGDTKKNDQQVVERFNKVADSYTLSSGFSGYIVYCVARDGKTLASHRFEK